MKQNVDVRHCRALIAVYDGGGVSAAARGLGVAQSTVSETLLALERLLEIPVTVRRAGREAMLTPEAEALIPYARALVAAAEAVLVAASQPRIATIRLGTVESISSFLLPGPLAEFRKQSPDADVRISIGLCKDLGDRVGRFELDAALTIEAADMGTGTASEPAETLAVVQLLFVVAPVHRLAGDVLTRQHIAQHTCLATDSEGAFIDLVKSWAGSDARSPKIESAGSVDGVKRGLAQGAAIGILPDYAVASELEAGSLVALSTLELLPRVAIRLLRSGRPHHSAALNTLVQKIREGLGRQDLPPRAPPN